MTIWLKLAHWLTGKAVLFLSIVLLCMIVLAAQYFVTEWIRSAETRVAHWEKVKEEAEATMREMETRKNSLEKDIQQRKQQLEAAKRRLDELDGLWNKLKDIFNPAERKRREAELRKKIREQEQAQRKIRSDLSSTESDRANAQSEFNKAEREREQAEAILNERKTSVSDVRDIVMPWVFTALKTGLVIFLLVVLMPYVYGLLGYYVLAPLIKRAKPLSLAGSDRYPESSSTRSQPAIKILLENDQEMVAKEEYLQAMQEDLKRSTCWIWEWNYPFTCFVCGLVMMTRVRNVSPNQGETRRVTFSHQEDGLLEISKIRIPENGALVIRPRFIAGLVYPTDQKPHIRSIWVFNRIHSWVTFQFRYFIIEGPVDLLIAAGRGVQMEYLDKNGRPQRINRNLTIAFSPALGYSSIRAETLMAYLMKKNPLFDDYFTGQGTIYNQQNSTGPGDQAAAEGAWGKFLSGIGKVFGF